MLLGWIHILAWIYRSCIVRKSSVLDASLHYVQRIRYAEILQFFLLFSMILRCRIQSPTVSKQQDVRWSGFRWSILLSFGYVCYSNIDRAISTPSCSYCIWNRYCKKQRSTLPNFLLFAWFDMVDPIVCHVQTKRCTMMRLSQIDYVVNWLCLRCVYW